MKLCVMLKAGDRIEYRLYFRRRGEGFPSLLNFGTTLVPLSSEI